MRVLLIGDHPWAGHIGEVIRECDPGPDGSCAGYIVELRENGIYCHTYEGQWQPAGGEVTDGE